MLDYVGDVLEWRVRNSLLVLIVADHYQLFTHDEMPSWVHPSGKVCLIGDSAHAMTPYLAQGAAMGIEDAAVLGGLLEKHPDLDTLHDNLLLYEQLRLKRAAKVATSSITSRWWTQMEDGAEQRARDEYCRTHPGIQPGHQNIRSRQEFLDWLFGYDAYEVLEEVITVNSRVG
jgi:salicylate hydroxylase